MSRAWPAAEIVVRPEEPQDFESVDRLNQRAFETGAESRLVQLLREAEDPRLSLVAAREDRIVGHIFFSPVRIAVSPPERLVMGLGPMAVDPPFQRQGIGSRLVESGLARCREDLSAAAVVVLGHREYYPRFGFQPARDFGLFYRDAGFDSYFMVLELIPGSLSGCLGAVDYPPAFEVVEDDPES